MHIEDESNDRNYFTIIPNYILNHSTANDQALYLQMKRYAGEKGECFASEMKLRKQLGIGRLGLKKSIQYLLDHRWIAHKGFKQIMTRGGMQDINVYVVNDIWKFNNEHYKGVSETTYLTKGVVETNEGGVQNDTKGVLQTTSKKNPIKKEPMKEEPTTTEPSSEVTDFINLFKEINPTYQYIFGRPNQRDASKRLLKLRSLAEWAKVVTFIISRRNDRFCPRISTPIQLEQKYADLQTYATGLKQQGEEIKNKYKVAFS